MNDILRAALKLEHGIEVKRTVVVRDWSESLVIRLDCMQRGKPAVKFIKRPGRRDDPESSIYRFAREHSDFPAPASWELHTGDDLWILMDEVSGTLLADAEGDVSRDAYLQAAEGLAGFHAAAVAGSWAVEFPNLRLSRNRAEALPASVMEALKRKAAEGGYEGLDTSLLSEVHGLADRYWNEYSASFFEFPFSMIHGDSHYGNLFIEPNADICLIDWSTAMAAPGLLDLAALWDVSMRMGQRIPAEKELLEAYFRKLPSEMAGAYGEPENAWRLCRSFRAFMELDWFCSTGYDFGSRATRELNILRIHLSSQGYKRNISNRQING